MKTYFLCEKYRKTGLECRLSMYHISENMLKLCKANIKNARVEYSGALGLKRYLVACPGTEISPPPNESR